ncbi:MAG: tyrosine--tRNA ligase, partial [Clostridia bacterium]|nr:tyrosine--tRNA ligase [Clostridia bacterium]
DENKTSPYDFYQYWRNVDDGDVMKCIKMLTFIPVEKIREMEAWDANRINEKKEVLAFELTKLVHGEEKAAKAQSQARAAFGGGGELPEKSVSVDAPTVINVLVAAGICASNGEARRLIQQGGVSLNDGKVTDFNAPVKSGDIIHKGKKVHVKIKLI